MSPTYSYNRHKKRYRYYVSQPLIQHREQDAGSVNKIPGDEIENFVRLQVKGFLLSKTNIQQYLNNYSISKQNKILESLKFLHLTDQIIRLVIHKITIFKEQVVLELNKNISIQILEKLAYNQEISVDINDTEFIEITKNAKIISTPRHGNKLITGNEIEYNKTLIQAITKGFYYYKLWKEGRLTQEQKCSTYTYRLMNLIFLPPQIVEDILYGKQSPALTVKKLHELAKFR